MSWAAGMALCMGLLVIVAIAAQVVDDDRKDVKRLQRLEAGRAQQELERDREAEARRQAEIDARATALEDACHYRRNA